MELDVLIGRLMGCSPSYDEAMRALLDELVRKRGLSLYQAVSVLSAAKFATESADDLAIATDTIVQLIESDEIRRLSRTEIFAHITLDQV